MTLRCLNCDDDGSVVAKGCLCGSCIEPCPTCNGTTRVKLTVTSLLSTVNYHLSEWAWDIRWAIFHRPVRRQIERTRRMLTVRELSICEVSLIKKALRVALANVEDPMAGQGDLYAAALEILEKKK